MNVTEDIERLRLREIESELIEIATRARITTLAQVEALLHEARRIERNVRKESFMRVVQT